MFKNAHFQWTWFLNYRIERFLIENFHQHRLNVTLTMTSRSLTAYVVPSSSLDGYHVEDVLHNGKRRNLVKHDGMKILF